MPIDPKVIDAQNLVEAKRAKFMATTKHALGEAKRRLAPDLIAEQAWKASIEAARNKSEELARRGTNLAKDKPWIVGAIAAVVALFFARKPVTRLANDAYDQITGNDKDEAELADDALEQKGPDTPVAVARRAKRVSPRKGQVKVENAQ